MSATLSTSGRFPVGTTVKVYEADAWPAHELPPEGPPPKGARLVARTKIHKDGTGKVGSRAKAGQAYYAYAEVDGEHRYVAFFGK